jgi:hypothetical protein
MVMTNFPHSLRVLDERCTFSGLPPRPGLVAVLGGTTIKSARPGDARLGSLGRLCCAEPGDVSDRA